MVIALITIWVLVAVLLGLMGVFWRRNNAVYDFLTHLNYEIYRFDTEDAEKVYRAQRGGRTAKYAPSWRREEFHTVSYDEMFWQPWRALDSFYREGFPTVEKPKPSQASDLDEHDLEKDLGDGGLGSGSWLEGD